ALTVQAAIRPDAKPDDLARPGHIFPLRAQQGGVLVRAGQTEASVDLARLAGRRPGAVICEIVNPDGTMARLPQLIEYCREHQLALISVADLIRYRLQNESYVRLKSEGMLDTAYGTFRLLVFENLLNSELHAALVKGELSPDTPTLVRMHSHCPFGDVFLSTQCDCRALLNAAMEKISAAGSGLIVYLHFQAADRLFPDPDSALTLTPHLRSGGQPAGHRKLQHQVGIGAQILRYLNCRKIELITNSTVRAVGLEGFGIEITGQVPVTLTTPAQQ
ncbi:MAG: 3,4-dihydroxy-2-butanone-4-phosphate synthase, partial [Candidatus Methylacidiphilales bacterium]|nr:3,4-dihydroxy-2-butanone-4-phosphate synthase [Candidatus Methylacidiphilales bacterium]